MRRSGIAARCMVVLVAGGLAALGAGCGGTDWPWDDFDYPGGIDIDVPYDRFGTLNVVVMWPEAQSADALGRGVPAGTDLVRVTLTGTGISAPWVDQCSEDAVTDGQARMGFDGVPSGDDRHLLAEAIDTDTDPEQVLASRSATVTVPDWRRTVEVHMDMALEQVLAVRPVHVWLWNPHLAPQHQRLFSATVDNAGGGTLNWTLSSDQPWLLVPPYSYTNDVSLYLAMGVEADKLPPWDPGDPPRDDVGHVTVDGGDLAVRIEVRVHREGS